MEDQSKQIAELKELVRRSTAISEETNRMVHSMKRAAWFGTIMQWLWWIIIFGVSGYAYYTYVQPYVAKIESAYHNAEAGAQKAQDWQTSTSNFFKDLFTPRQ
jgi:hypothetical protein